MKRNQFEKPFSEDVSEGTNELINSIKLILYKRDNLIFEELDFDKDEIYLEPSVFAGINSKLKVDINSIIWGYKNQEYQNIPINIWTDQNGLIYMPNIGYFITSIPKTEVQISFDNDYFLRKQNKSIEYQFEKIIKIHDCFEVATHPIYLFDEHFFDEFGTNVPVESSKIASKHLNHLMKAFDSIQKYAPKWYEIMKMVTRKIVIFNDQSEKRNSFATQSVHGCAFFNAFQDNFNEVFFIEDIAHQCGHIIFNAFLANKPDIFLIDKETDVFLDIERDEFNEPRALYVMMHAMYTYESIFTCFDPCLESDEFIEEKQHEMFGRLAFALLKFKRDYDLLNKLNEYGDSIYFTQKGVELINVFKQSFDHCILKWGKHVALLNLENQPYNFSYSDFLKLNPLPEYEVI